MIHPHPYQRDLLPWYVQYNTEELVLEQPPGSINPNLEFEAVEISFCNVSVLQNLAMKVSPPLF